MRDFESREISTDVTQKAYSKFVDLIKEGNIGIAFLEKIKKFEGFF
jgi:DNA-directed RNA polymerase sigma subunit (sigma70/sigma32)